MKNLDRVIRRFKMKKFIAFGLIGLFALFLVSAAVYTYVSNTAKVDVSITQPLKVYLNDDTSLTSLNLAVTSANPINFKINEDSLTTNPVQVYNVLIEVTAPQNFDGTEFTSIKLTDDNGLVNQEVLGAVKFIKADGTYDSFANIAGQNTKTAKLMMASDGVNLVKYTHTAGSQKWSSISIQPALGIASGDYDLKVCKVYNLVGATCA
jgi:hypothetical protein